MILVTLIAILFIGGLACWSSERIDQNLPRVIALVTVILDFALMFGLLSSDITSTWVAVFEASWIPRFGISVYLAADGLSVLLLMLTAFLGVIAIGAAWDEVK